MSYHDDSADYFTFFLGFYIGCLAILILLFFAGPPGPPTVPHTDAIEAGVAHYVVDPHTGEVRFEFITPKTQEKEK